MPEFIPMPDRTKVGKNSLPSMSSLGSGMRISLATVLIVALVAFVVWKFVLKK